MSAFFTPDEVAIISGHRFDTTCYVVAESGNCLVLQTEGIRRVTGRRLVPVRKERLPEKLRASWLMAVLVCPDDDLSEVAAWAAGLRPADFARIKFYEHKRLPDLAATYRAWSNRRLPDPSRFPVENFAELNRLLGLDLNRQILQDFRA